MRNWFNIEVKKSGPVEIWIYDEIGAFGIRADRFIEALKSKGDVGELALHINSPGGDPFAAAAMYLALKRHPAKVTAFNDGLVASAASMVLMAGDHIVMPENTMLMIHDPVGGVLGTADEMRDFADAMDKIKQTILTAYRRSGKTDEQLAEIMSAETWYTATEALANGFVDEISNEIRVAAFFDLGKFADPPAALLKHPAPLPAPVEFVETVSGETVEQIRADAVQTEKQRALKIAALCTAAGRPEIAGELIGQGVSADEAGEKLKMLTSVTLAGELKSIFALCSAAGVVDLAERFVTEGRNLEWVRNRLADAAKIQARCVAGGMPNRAAAYIRANATAQEVGENLLELKIAMQGPEIDNTISPDMTVGARTDGQRPAARKLMTNTEIYAMRNRRQDDKADLLATLRQVLR